MKFKYFAALTTAFSVFAVDAQETAPFPDWGKPYAVTSVLTAGRLLSIQPMKVPVRFTFSISSDCFHY